MAEVKIHNFHPIVTLNHFITTNHDLIDLVSIAKESEEPYAYRYANLLLFDLWRVTDGLIKFATPKLSEFHSYFDQFKSNASLATKTNSGTIHEYMTYNRIFSIAGMNFSKFPEYTKCTARYEIYDTFVDIVKDLAVEDREDFIPIVNLVTEKYLGQMLYFINDINEEIQALEAFESSSSYIKNLLHLVTTLRFDFWRAIQGMTYCIEHVCMKFIENIIHNKHDFGASYPKHVVCFTPDPSHGTFALIDDAQVHARVEFTFTPLKYFGLLDEGRWTKV
jgi:hypothetical protein